MRGRSKPPIETIYVYDETHRLLSAIREKSQYLDRANGRPLPFRDIVHMMLQSFNPDVFDRETIIDNGRRLSRRGEKALRSVRINLKDYDKIQFYRDKYDITHLAIDVLVNTILRYEMNK